MARRRQRDTSDIASQGEPLSRLLSTAEPSITVSRVARPVSLPPVEDRRRFDFNPPTARARRLDGTPARVVYAPAAARGVASRAAAAPGFSSRKLDRARALASRQMMLAAQERYRFTFPQEVAICVRRRVRREVLHALFGRLRGMGGGGRRGPYSDVRC